MIWIRYSDLETISAHAHILHIQHIQHVVYADLENISAYMRIPATHKRLFRIFCIIHNRMANSNTNTFKRLSEASTDVVLLLVRRKGPSKKTRLKCCRTEIERYPLIPSFFCCQKASVWKIAHFWFHSDTYLLAKKDPTVAGLEPAIPRSEVWCLIH